jgi:pimeloyl-ACP methyl ester carboxylesterase
MTADAMLVHAKALIDALGVREFHVAGHDEGALMALQLGFDMPGRVRSCILAGGPAITPSSESVPNELLSFPPGEPYSEVSQRWIAERKSWTGNHLEDGGYLAEAVDIAAGAEFRAIRAALEQDEVIQGLRKSFRAMKARTFGRFHAGLPVPCLLVWGNDDALTPPVHARTLFDLISPQQPRTEMHIINRSGNLPFRENPPAFDAALLAFADAVESAGAGGKRKIDNKRLEHSHET